MQNTVSQRIQQRFGTAAKGYDLYCDLHREVADNFFADVIKDTQPSFLLDVGCGTGYLAVMAKEIVPQSKIVGLDFSQEMLRVARLKRDDINWVLADGLNLPFTNGNFDMVISNLAYQWAGDLTKAFSEAGRVLNTDGVLASTIFGYDTCKELFQALDEASQGSLKFLRLPRQFQIYEALVSSGFKNPRVSCELKRQEFKDMHGLLSWLKAIGANNLSREGYLGREIFSHASSIYQKKFSCPKGVWATFEVIKIYARK